MDGEFAVREPGTLTEVPKKIGLGPLGDTELADFAGKVSYSAEVEVPANTESLVLGTGRAAATVRLGGRDLGTRLFAPWRYPVPADLRGRRAKLEITVTTSVRPMFGKESDDVPGALPSNKPGWVKTIAPERNVGLNYARWE